MSQNKLEEYRDKILPMENGVPNYLYKREGFDAAIALDLPVKFAIWLALNGIKTDYKDDKGEIHWYKMELASHQHKGTTKELYQYWIENVLKIE